MISKRNVTVEKNEWPVVTRIIGLPKKYGAFRLLGDVGYMYHYNYVVVCFDL